MSLRNRAVIVGVGESDIGRLTHMTGLGLNAQAARRAIADAGLKHTQIDGLLTAYSFTEPYFMLGSVLAEYLGIVPTYGGSIITGGASPTTMLSHAAQAVETGMAEVVLVCAGENRATGMSRDEAVGALIAVGHPYFEAPYGVGIPSLYGLVANAYMAKYGTTRAQMAAVAANTRGNALKHPNAHMKTPLTVQEVLDSKPISDPLNMYDCCLISDAGGAFVVTTPERAKDLPGKPIYLAGIGEAHTHEHLTSAPSLTEFGAELSGRKAYDMAGLGPSDIDVAMLYDCFSIVPIIEMEELGLAERGAGGAFFAEGHAAIGGKLPINTHGGMLSHAHAGAVGGLMGIIEAVRQLRNEAGDRQTANATTALVHGEGGILSSHCTATDIVNFCCLSGDFNGVHADHEYCKSTPFGEPIAHAPLVYAIMGGLTYASGINDGTLLAVLGIDGWRMHGPVKHGDTLFMRQTVEETREPSKPNRGIVAFKREFVNQRGEAVQSMKATFMYKRKAAA